jgi:hypothetical protein
MQELIKLSIFLSLFALLSCNEKAKPNTKATDLDSTQIDHLTNILVA